MSQIHLNELSKIYRESIAEGYGMGEIDQKVVLINTMSSNKGAFVNWKNNNLTLNYYVLSKNVDIKIIDAVRNNAKIQDIANKKQMQPVELETKEAQVEYLIRNQNKWTK